jgi:putative transcriptional regulator
MNVAGHFLVATPVIATPPFARSVILMLEHDESGAVGLILNAETAIPVSDHLPEIAHLTSEPSTVFVGGPVASDTAVLLGRSDGGSFLRPTALDNIGILDVDSIPGDLEALRVFAGYSGWSPWQLEAELDSGSWWALPVERGLVFEKNTSAMWNRVVASAPGTIPFHATFPSDVTAN